MRGKPQKNRKIKENFSFQPHPPFINRAHTVCAHSDTVCAKYANCSCSPAHLLVFVCLSITPPLQIFLRQGTAAAVDIVGEAKLARREAAINGACDVTVTEVVDKVAGLVETLSKTASDTASANAKMAADVATKQQAMNELLTEMVNITATAVANAVGSTTTNNFDLSTSAGAQLAATSMEKQPSCRAYKVRGKALSHRHFRNVSREH